MNIRFKNGLTGRVEINGSTMSIFFPFSNWIKDEIKASFQGRKFDWDRKCWTAPVCARNTFALYYLCGKDPYAAFPNGAGDYAIETALPVLPHQREAASMMLTRPGCIIAYEMGTGKTLAALLAIQESLKTIDTNQVVYVGPKSGTVAFRREVEKWGFNYQVWVTSYEQLGKVLTLIAACNPKFLIVDESQKVKTPTAQRSQAVRALADEVRNNGGRVVLLTGTPAPKDPSDWWNQCEIACPGYIREGDPNTLKRRLAVIEDAETPSGVKYPKFISWKDDEVAKMYERLKGLVIVKKKKDCLNLPDVTFDEIILKPTVETLRAAQLIAKSKLSTMAVLTRLRELSDGFQYFDSVSHYVTCVTCNGEGTAVLPMPNEPLNELAPVSFDITDKETTCPTCGGTGKTPIYKQETVQLDSPKDLEIVNQLDAHEEHGRLIIWAGFTASIDRVVTNCQKNGWAVLRVDGRGYHGFDPEGNALPDKDLLSAMDYSHPQFERFKTLYPLLAFVGQPSSGGMALTLTAAPTMVYFSNTFDGMGRLQSEARFHRAGMPDWQPKIIDLIHLPSDRLVLKNLREKNRLQNLTLGEVEQCLK